MLSPDAVNSGQWMAAGHVVMGDATRSKAWREDKIQPLCLVSWYCSEDADISSHTAWPDVQVVKSESAAANLIRMHKQLRLVQCCCFDVGEATRLGARQVRMIWLCGDNGSDQLFVRPMVADMYKGHCNVLVFGMPCLAHQQSLMSCRQLIALDLACTNIYKLGFKYDAGLVKIANLLRSRPGDVYKAAVNMCNGYATHSLARCGK